MGGEEAGGKRTHTVCIKDFVGGEKGFKQSPRKKTQGDGVLFLLRAILAGTLRWKRERCFVGGWRICFIHRICERRVERKKRKEVWAAGDGEGGRKVMVSVCVCE